MPGNIRDFLNRVNREHVYIPKLLAIPTYEYVFRRITRRCCSVLESRSAFSISAVNRNIGNASKYVKITNEQQPNHATTYAEIASVSFSLFLPYIFSYFWPTVVIFSHIRHESGTLAVTDHCFQIHLHITFDDRPKNNTQLKRSESIKQYFLRNERIREIIELFALNRLL